MLHRLIRSILRGVEELKLRIHRQHSSHQKPRPRSRTYSSRRDNSSVLCWYYQTFRKRGQQALLAASSPCDSAGRRVLFIHERNSGKYFLVESGANVSANTPHTQIADGPIMASPFKLSTALAPEPWPAHVQA